MRYATALHVLEEMQKWRRGEYPYDKVSPNEYVSMPYSPNVFGKAIDMAIRIIKKREDERKDDE